MLRAYACQARLFAVLLLAVGTGCASQGIRSPAEGTFEVAGAGHLRRVESVGSLTTSPLQIQNNVLCRAAIIARSDGRSNFLLYSRLVDAAVGKWVDQPHMSALGGQTWAFAFVQGVDGVRAGAKSTTEVLQNCAS
jgi:hypothetical protein